MNSIGVDVDQSFGPHMMLDFFTDSNKLNDKEYWESLLERMVDLIGMTPLSGPFVYPSVCTNPDWDPPTASGVSGFIVLAESHISFHTFVESQFVFMDVFSCKPFDTSVVTEWLGKELGAHNFDVQLAKRGRTFPRKVREMYSE